MDTKNYSAINNLMQTIKEEEENKNKTKSSEEELLLVRIPMPETQKQEPKIIRFDLKNNTKKGLDKSLDFDDLFLISVPRNKNKTEGTTVTIRTPKRDLQVFPIIRRGIVTRTNRTNIRKRRLRPNTDT